MAAQKKPEQVGAGSGLSNYYLNFRPANSTPSIERLALLCDLQALIAELVVRVDAMAAAGRAVLR